MASKKNKFSKAFLAASILMLQGCSSGGGGALSSSSSPDPIVSSSEEQKTPDLTSEVFSLEVYRDTSLANSIEGVALIHAKKGIPSSIKSLTLKWGDDSSPFSDYDSLIDFEELKGDEYEYDFKKNALIPEKATKLWLLGMNEEKEVADKATYDVTSFKKKSKLLYEFQVISDQQITTSSPAFYRRSKKAFADIKENSPDSILLAVNGDIVDEAKSENYDSFLDSFYQSYGKEEKEKLALGIGNHEFIVQAEDAYYTGVSESELEQRYKERVSLWKEKTGNSSVYFSLEKEGSRFVFLGATKMPETLDGNSRADCVLGEEQLAWLKEEVSAAKTENKPLYIFSHGSLRDTVSGSLSKLNQTWYGYSKEEEKQLREILSSYPKTLFFSSHSHWCFESEQPYLIEDESPISYFNTAAIGYLWEGSANGHSYKNGSYENGGAQGLYISVYEDQIFIKGRQFEASDGESKYWFSNYQTLISI